MSMPSPPANPNVPVPAQDGSLSALATKLIPFLLAIIIAGGGYYFARIDARVTSLENKYDADQMSAGRVEVWLAKSPKLEDEINDIRVNTSGLPEMKKTVDATRDSVTKLEATMEQFQKGIRDQLNNIQYQIHNPDNHK